MDWMELMHEDEVILRSDHSSRVFKVLNESKLPHALNKWNLSVSDITEWISRRTSNRNRTHMNKVYMVRGIGRDGMQILIDSAAVSAIDNFWVRNQYIMKNWQTICSTKDTNKDLIKIALYGEVPQEFMSKKHNDVTSLFTLKGAFPKVVDRNVLLKRGYNAHYEIAGYLIGDALNISVAVAEDLGDDTVACHLFTNTNCSMHHMDDILEHTPHGNDVELYQAVYEYYWILGRHDLIVQLERLYLLAYITINIDMHQENFGTLYSPKDFSSLRVAPAYDFNNAFQTWGDVTFFDPWIISNLAKFIRNHPDIVQMIPKTISVTQNCKYLSDVSKGCVIERLQHLMALASN